MKTHPVSEILRQLPDLVPDGWWHKRFRNIAHVHNAPIRSAVRGRIRRRICDPTHFAIAQALGRSNR